MSIPSIVSLSALAQIDARVLVSKSWCRNFGFVQSVGYPAFIGIETVWSLNSKLRASLREAFMKFTRCIELNPQYPYISLVIRGPDQSKVVVKISSDGRRWRCSPNGSLRLVVDRVRSDYRNLVHRNRGQAPKLPGNLRVCAGPIFDASRGPATCKARAVLYAAASPMPRFL